jgi:hypothetical protein
MYFHPGATIQIATKVAQKSVTCRGCSNRSAVATAIAAVTIHKATAFIQNMNMKTKTKKWDCETLLFFNESTPRGRLSLLTTQSDSNKHQTAILHFHFTLTTRGRMIRGSNCMLRRRIKRKDDNRKRDKDVASQVGREPANEQGRGKQGHIQRNGASLKDGSLLL